MALISVVIFRFGLSESGCNYRLFIHCKITWRNLYSLLLLSSPLFN